MANRNIEKRLQDLKQAVNPADNLIVVYVDWGENTTVDFQGVTYTKAEWDRVKYDLGFDGTVIVVNYDDRDPEDQDNLSPIRSP